MPARDAIRLMKERGYSQVPVVQGTRVLGVFSFRAFSLEFAEDHGDNADPGALAVEEFLEHEKVVYAGLEDDFSTLIEVLDTCDAVVVSGPNELIGVLTPMDVVKYLHSVANAFVLLQEIELAVRTLIQLATPKREQLLECINHALSQQAGSKKPPERLEDMTFGHYISMIRDGRNWRYFGPVLGGTRDRARTKLEPIGELRNDIFHFKREISADDHQCLARCRAWLLRCIRKAEAARRGS